MSTLGLAIYKGRNFLKHIPPNKPLSPPVIPPKPPELPPVKTIAEFMAEEARLRHELEVAKANIATVREKMERLRHDVFVDHTTGTVQPKIQRILQVTVNYYNEKYPEKELFISDIISHRRTKYPSLVRHIAMYLAKVLTYRSLPVVGRIIGDRDHTTVLTAIRKIERLRKSDAELDADIKAIIGIIEGANEPAR